MTGFWRLYRLRNRAKRKMIRDILTFFFNRSCHTDSTESIFPVSPP